MKILKNVFIAVCVLLINGCNQKEKVVSIQKSETYYDGLLQEKMKEAGIVNTSYFKVEMDWLSMEGKGHDDIMRDMDKVIAIFKESYEHEYDKKLKQTMLFMSVVKANGLEKKEQFYQQLYKLKTAKERVDLYVSEHLKFSQEVAIAKKAKDEVLQDEIIAKYKYLFLVVRANDGSFVPGPYLERKEGVTYAIEKYENAVLRD